MATAFEEAIRLKFETAGLEGLSEVEKALVGLGDVSEDVQAKVLTLVDAMVKAAEAGDLARKYRETGAALREIDKAYREQVTAVKELDAAEKASAGALAEKTAALEAAKATQQAYKDGSHGLIGSTEQIAAAHKAAKADVAALTAEVRAATREQANDAAALERSRDALAKVADQRERTLALVRTYGAQLKAAGVDVTRLAAEEQRLAAEAAQAADQLEILAQVTRENATVARDTADATNEAAQAQVSLGDAFSKSKAAIAAAAASLYGVQRALSGAAADSSAFATAMAKINTQLDDSGNLDEISESLRRLSREFGSDIIANAEAFYETMSAGGADWAESLELMAEANKLAAVGGADLVDTAKLVRAAIAAYGKDVGDAAEVSDQLYHALRIGNLSLEQLAGTLPKVASLASTAGVSLGELNTAIGVLTTGGLPAAEAGTALTGMLQAVIKPTEQAAKLAKDLGLEFNTTALATKGLAGFLQEVMQKTGGADTALATLFGSVNGLNGVLQLGGSLLEDFRTGLDGLPDAIGRVNAAFQKFDETPAQRMAQFNAAMKDLRISLGDVVTSFTPVLDGLTALVNGFNELPGPIRTGVAGLGTFAAVAGTLTIAARGMKPALTALGLAMPAIGQGAADSAKGVGLLGTALKGFGATMALGFAIDKVSEAYNAINGLAEVNKQLAEAERDVRTVRAEQIIEIDRLKEKYAELADAQIRNADLLESMSESDLSGYLRQLDGAGKYWRAIEIEARNAGDAQSQAFARDRADQFTQAAANARDRLAEVRAQLDGIASAAGTAFAKIHGELFTVATTADKLTKHLDEAFKDRSFASTADEIGQIAVALAQVGTYAEQSDKIVREGLEASLTKLAGRDLLLFRDAAKAAFDEAGTSASNAASVMETVIRSAMAQLGMSAQAAGRQITAEGENVIALFEVVAQSGTATADQVEQAFKAALGRLSTSGEAEALGEALKAAGEQGAIGAEAADRAMAALKRRIDELKQAAAPLADAFAQLGIKSQAELQRAADAARSAFDEIVDGMRRGEATQVDAMRAFSAYAAAARAAVAGSSEAVQQQLEAQLQAQAAAVGLTEKLQQAGEAGKRAGEDTAAAMAKARQAVDGVASATGQVQGDIQNTGEIGATAMGKIGEGAKSASMVLSGIPEILQGVFSRFQSLGDEAVSMFGRMMEASQGFFGSEFFTKSAADQAMDRYIGQFEAMASILEGNAQAMSMLASRSSDVAAVLSDLGYTAEDVAKGVVGTGEAIRALNQIPMDRLQPELRGVADELRRIDEQAASATNQLQAMVDAYKRSQLQREEDHEALSSLQLQDDLRRIDELARAGSEADAAVAGEARRLAEAEHRARLREIKEREQEEVRSRRNITQQPTPEPTTPAPRPDPSGGGQIINVHIDGRLLGSYNNLNDPRELKRMVEQLIREFANRGGGF